MNAMSQQQPEPQRRNVQQQQYAPRRQHQSREVQNRDSSEEVSIQVESENSHSEMLNAPPAPPGRSGGGGRGRGGRGGGRGRSEEGRNPSQLMDDVIGSDPVPTLQRSGRATSLLAQQIRGAENPEPILAGIYWLAAIRTKPFMRFLRDHHIEPTFANPTLVIHAEGTRFDLLLLSPDYEGEPTEIPMDVPTRTIMNAFLSHNPRRSVFRTLSAKYPWIDWDTVRESLVEVSQEGVFGAVLAGEPETIPTGVPVPSVPVFDAYQGSLISTLGLVLTRGDELLATTARHGVIAAPESVYVGGEKAQLRKDDPVTDSCLLCLDSKSTPPTLMQDRGVLRTVMPPMGSEVYFYRCDEGRVSTVIIQSDLSILEPQQEFASKVYTDADTIPGDSGVALLDSEEKVICFAARRTGFTARIVNSQWIYAAQALEALGVLEKSDGAVGSHISHES